MSPTTRIGLLAFCAALLVGAAGCGGRRTPPAPAGPITIGALLELTGEGAEYGKDAQRGIDLAVDEINRAGDIDGRGIRVVYEDTQAKPALAASGAQKLVTQNKVPVVIGALYSSGTLAALPVTERAHVVLFSPGSSSPKLTGAGAYFFRNWISDTSEGAELARFAFTDLRLERVAIIYINSDYGVGLRDVFGREFKRLGGSIPVSEGYTQGSRDFRTALLKARQARPDAVYLPGYYSEIAQILKQAREMAIKVQFLSAVGFEDPKMVELAGNAAEGVIYSAPGVDLKSASPTIRAFSRAFRRRYGRDPGLFGAHAYDAVKILAIAIRSKGTAPDEIRQGLRDIKNYPGVTGTTTFDAKGDVVKPVQIKTLRGGKFMPLPPAAVKTQ